MKKNKSVWTSSLIVIGLIVAILAFVIKEEFLGIIIIELILLLIIIKYLIYKYNKENKQ